MDFTSAFKRETNYTTTENGALAHQSTLSACLDLFGQIACARDNLPLVRRLMSLALAEDKETAVRILFWARDIRSTNGKGGQGERLVFRTLLKDLASCEPEITKQLVPLIPFYGRWDDVFALEDTPAWSAALQLIEGQLSADRKSLSAGGSVSLLGKWMPSINASSKESRRLGRRLAKHLNLNEKEYRKLLTSLRTQIKIVEQKMCAGQWKEIDYPAVPSKASLMYRTAFHKHDGERYQEYIDAVASGKEKINAQTLYPYEVVQKCLYEDCEDQTLDVLWAALPNYMEGISDFNGLVVADVSGSMRGTPMAVAISLAMYIAERNNHPIWKDKFITFSSEPKLQSIVGATIADRVRNLRRADWGYSTNFYLVFKTILDAALKHQVPADEMPQQLIVVSDMQFDEADEENTNLQSIRDLYAEKGYAMPSLIFWNVRANNNVPMTVDDKGTCLVSGSSPTTLKAILGGKIIGSMEILRDSVYNERYEEIGKVFN